MKRVVTLIVVALMIASLGVFSGYAKAEEAQKVGRDATYIAVRWTPVGYNFAANKLYPDRTRNFEIGGSYTGFGTEAFRMPACTDNPLTGAVRQPLLQGHLYNIPATEATDVEPRFWTEFYLTVHPDAGRSQESDHWFAVIDSGGNVWFDPDGFFHDSRYYGYADPLDNLYNTDDTSLFDNCQRNPKALVDPTTANNTQGPYPLLPTDENGNANPGYVEAFQVTPFDIHNPQDMFSKGEMPSGMGSTPMYFMEPKSKRLFRLGWVDMVDFPYDTVVGNSHNELAWQTQASYWNIPANEFWNHRYDDWDYNMNLVRFRDGAGMDVGPDGPFWAPLAGPPNADANTGRRDNSGFASYDSPIWDWGEEWHMNNIKLERIPPTDPNQTNPSRYQKYEHNEWIYRGGEVRAMMPRIWAIPGMDPPIGRNMVMGYDPYFSGFYIGLGTEEEGFGDQRLTPVSVNVNLITYNYAPGTSPIDRGPYTGNGAFGRWDPGDDYDIGYMYAVDNQGVPVPSPLPNFSASPFRLSPGNFGSPDPGPNYTEFDEVHAENISSRLLGRSRAPLYDPYEHIYAKSYRETANGRIPNTAPRVEFGDLRRSNVNSNQHPWAVWQFDREQPTELPKSKLGGLWAADAFIVAEVLTAVCNDKDFYNLSVETDLWEGVIPSTTTAVLRSQLGEITQRGQIIQKSTVLGPTPTSFAVPATTFMEVYPRSRQYLGVEIFNDNGQDNNLGAEHKTDTNNTPPDTDRLYANNLSDDYRPGRTTEEYLGAQDPNASILHYPWFFNYPESYDQYFYMRNFNAKDVGRKLSHFWNSNPPIRFLDSRFPGGQTGETTFNIYGCGEAIYLDVNNNFSIDNGDKRLSDVKFTRNGILIEYKAGTPVNIGDADIYAWGPGLDLNDFTPKAPQLFSLPGFSEYHYAMYYDEYMVDPDNPERLLPPNGTYDPGEMIYDTNIIFSGLVMDAYVEPGFQRLSAGWVGDTWYECGSIVPAFDFFEKPSVPYGVTAGLNCDPRFMDWEVIPGDVRLDVKVDRALMVEQTSDITVSVEGGLKEGHWINRGDHQEWVPDELLYVIVRDPNGIATEGVAASNNLNAMFRVLTPKSPKATFTMTPYRGSCHPLNFLMTQAEVDAMKVRIQAFKLNRNIGIFANRTWMTDLMVVPPDQHSGYRDPNNPRNFRQETMHFYRDLFWSGDWVNLMNRKPATYGGLHWNQRRKLPGFKSPGIGTPLVFEDIAPSPPLPMTLGESYDCYSEYLLDVLPEKMNIEANVACITTLDQRFPNITLNLFDDNNPNDVNDPYGIAFSVPKTDNPVIAHYNAHGGGVDWLGVAQLANPKLPDEKVIFQANIDGTYEYWYWFEPPNTDPDLGPQVPNAIDPNDVIIGQEYTTFPLPCATSADCGTNEVAIKRTGIYVDSRSHWEDNDCSVDSMRPCEVYMPEGMHPIGEITGQWYNPLASDHFGIFDGTFGWIVEYGVPTYVTPYGELTPSDIGGQCQIVVHPKDGSTHINIHVYLQRAVFDYNSTIAHPTTGSPYFRTDFEFGTPPFNPSYIYLGSTIDGIDYAGTLDLKVYPPDPYVNFAEWLIVDHALQYSNVNYTVQSATNPPLSQLPPPAPQIQPPYWPILRTSHGGFRCYPGGQTHTGRVTGQDFSQNGGAFGWNAYPAIWSEDIQRDLKAERFFKLGTEFFPLTDYGLYFILKDGEGRHLSFDAPDLDRTIKRIEIVGPFARPQVVDVTTNRVVTGFTYNNLGNVPINYDYSGKLVIDETNWSTFERKGSDFLNWSPLGDVDFGSYKNIYLKRTQRLDYCNLDNVFVIDELIPWNYGKIFIYVTLADGTFKMYQDCCTAPPVDGIDVRALELKQTEGDENFPVITHLTLDPEKQLDQKISFTLKEYEPIQVESFCNDAIIYAWQDRGVKDPRGKLFLGAGDGWPTNAPSSSRSEQYHTMFRPDQDLNGDNFVTFDDWETELLGKYNMATNAWSGGYIDARTFQRNSGRYDFEFGLASSAHITTVGLDFGSDSGKSQYDHIIGNNEVLPVYITAYKYGDDNNDRSFGPWWDFDAYFSQFNASKGLYDRTRYSHEVYIAAQVALPIEPADDLIISYSPNPLTSGITPELVDVNSPLTFIVKNKNGTPMNLLSGIPDGFGLSDVDIDDAWNILFKDPHPDNTYYYGLGATLPQYYFLRTDLQNYDGTMVNNRELYSTRIRSSDECNNCKETILEAFEPISVDFSNSKSGIYIFRGFCANDNNVWMKDEDHPDKEAWEQSHIFRVYIYTPDRMHRGTVDVKIVNPHVEYKIINTEDQQLKAFNVPGEPDFIMTAADNRIYKIEVTVSNAQGQLVKGVTKGVSVCGGGVKNTARFTPFTTRPQSFDFRDQNCDYVPCLQVVYPHFGFDFNGDGIITWQDQELFNVGGFTLRPITSKCWDRQSVGQVFYNTANEYFRVDKTWNIVNEGTAGQRVEVTNLLLPPPPFGWGLGAIYNWQYWGGFLFADLDRNGKLDYHDALGLDVNAQTSFFAWAEDLCYIGGLVGDNVYVNTPSKADLVGYPPYSDKTNPRYMEKRFRGGVTNDTVFFMDWEGIPDKVAQVSYPRVELFYAENGEEVSKDLLNVDNYDMVYNVDNHFIARLYPAFADDLPLKEDARLYVSGDQAQQQVFGHTKKSLEDDLATETTFHFTPTGTGQSTVYLSYLAKNMYFNKEPYLFDNPEWYGLKKIYHIDTGKGLEVVIASDNISPSTTSEIVVYVKEIGTGALVPEATVYIDGPGIDQTSLTTNANGEVKVKITPKGQGKIVVTADHDDYISGSTFVMVGKDNIPPMLDVDPVPLYTNKTSLDVTGKTEPGAKVTVGGIAARVDDSGKLTAKINLKEGTNAIIVEATDASNNKTMRIVHITLDTVPPAYLIDGLDANDQFVIAKDATKIKVSGRVDSGSEVTINGAPATVVYDIWVIEISMDATLNEMNLTLQFKDKAGNPTEKTIKVVRAL